MDFGGVKDRYNILCDQHFTPPQNTDFFCLEYPPKQYSPGLRPTNKIPRVHDCCRGCSGSIPMSQRACRLGSCRRTGLIGPLAWMRYSCRGPPRRSFCPSSARGKGGGGVAGPAGLPPGKHTQRECMTRQWPASCHSTCPILSIGPGPLTVDLGTLPPLLLALCLPTGPGRTFHSGHDTLDACEAFRASLSLLCFPREAHLFVLLCL